MHSSSENIYIQFCRQVACISILGQSLSASKSQKVGGLYASAPFHLLKWKNVTLQMTMSTLASSVAQ